MEMESKATRAVWQILLLYATILDFHFAKVRIKLCGNT